METLNSDCFFEIFPYLSLADLLNLRTLSRRLKQEVEKYLPTIRSLSLYLTTPRTPEAISEYENFILPIEHGRSICGIDELERKHRLRSFSNIFNGGIGFRRLSFGTSRLKTFEDRTFLQNQNHFRSDDFLILNCRSGLRKFLRLIKKHCLNIEKLALVIDHFDHYRLKLATVLRAFPVIKVLLMERTLRDSYRDNKIDSYPQSVPYRFPYMAMKSIQLPVDAYNCILEMASLEELYFFPKRYSQLFMSGLDEARVSFIEQMLHRLRVFHFNHNSSRFELPVSDVLDGPLEELSYNSEEDYWPNRQDKLRLFPGLKKLTLLGSNWGQWRPSMLYDSISKLEVLDISTDYSFTEASNAENLNYLTGLKSFRCRFMLDELRADRYRFDEDENGEQKSSPKRMKMEENDNDTEIVPEELKNRTIKHLQVLYHPGSADDRKRAVRRWSKYFVALETCVILKWEYSEFRISDF